MKSMDIELSIIVVNWNTEDALSECLNSFFSMDRDYLGFNFEVIVVDNASSDNSIEMVRASFAEGLPASPICTC